MTNAILYYFKVFPTVRYATLSLLLISLCAALLGVPLVLKRFSMIGDGLSHVTFGATAVATVLSLTTPIYLTLPLTILAAILLLQIRTSSKIGGDAAIAMLSAGALTAGYLLLNLFPSEAGAGSDACTSLFGSGILSIQLKDVLICAALSLAVLLLFFLFYHKIFAVTFDESFAAATGIRAALYNTIIASITGVIIVVAMEMVGALLVSALITFPALSAMRLFKSFKSVTICAAVISVFCALAGILISLCLATPIGPTIVVADLIAFSICALFGAVKS